MKHCYAFGKSHNRGSCPAHDHTFKTCGRSYHHESICRNEQSSKKQFSYQKKKPVQNQYTPKIQSVDVQESSREEYFWYSVNVQHIKPLLN